MKTKADEIFLLESLTRRRPLLQDEQDFYQKLLSGYQGEKAFENLFQKACPHLNLLLDFQVQVYSQDLQIDALACVDEYLYHFEIKNYDFDFTYRQGQAFFGRSQKAIENPFRQLKRSQALLKQLLQKYGKPIKVVSLVVFINENCRVDVDETCDSLCFSRREAVEFLGKLAHSTTNLALANWL